MKKLLFLFMLLASSMTCLAQKFTPGEYVESGEGKGDLYIPSRITLQNGRFTCKAMSGFPTFTSGSDLAYLEFASNFTGSHTVSGTYTASNGNLRLTVTSVTPTLKWRGNYQLVRNYTFSYDSNSITIGSKTLYNKKAAYQEDAAEEARQRREDAATMTKLKSMETRLAPVCAREKKAATRPILYVAVLGWGEGYLNDAPKEMKAVAQKVPEIDIRFLSSSTHKASWENNKLTHKYYLPISFDEYREQAAKEKLYFTKYADEVCLLDGDEVHHLFPASGKPAKHDTGLNLEKQADMTSWFVKYIAETYSPTLKALEKEKEEKLAAMKKEMEEKLAAIKDELTQKYGGNRFRIWLAPSDKYDDNKGIRQALVKELKASTTIALLDSPSYLPKKSVYEMNDQELHQYVMATYFPLDATVSLYYRRVETNYRTKESSKVGFFGNIAKQTVCEAKAYYDIYYMLPNRKEENEWIAVTAEVSERAGVDVRELAEKKALANAKPIYDAIVKYAKKAQAKNASGEPSSASGTSSSASGTSSSASGTSSPSLSGSRAKVGPARVSTGT